MTFHSALAGIMFLGLAVPEVSAAETIVPPDPWEIIHVARVFGPAEVTQDGMRDPLIRGEMNGRRYEIGFYGCWLGRECKSVLFQIRLQREEWTPNPKAVAAWNAEKLFGRAWLGEDAVVVLDHPVAMSGGLSRKTLDATFDAWQVAVEEFTDFVDF